MVYILFKIADFLIAICVASIVAPLSGYVAHYLFGLSRLDIHQPVDGIRRERRAVLGGQRVAAVGRRLVPGAPFLRRVRRGSWSNKITFISPIKLSDDTLSFVL
jgi:hypothetical protein